MVRYQYIWFAVTPCVYLLSRQSLFLENCLALFYCRGVDNRAFGRLLSSEKNCPAFNYYQGRWYRKQTWTTTLAYRIVINCTAAESILSSQRFDQLALVIVRRLYWVPLPALHNHDNSQDALLTSLLTSGPNFIALLSDRFCAYCAISISQRC